MYFMGHMKNINLKWAALFLFLILFPASILTYLSVQVLRDEKRSALVDLNLLVPRLQNAFDQMLNHMIQVSHSDFDGVRVMLDHEGVFVQPKVLPLTFGTRNKAFEMAFAVGEIAEFQRQHLAEAWVFYLDALQVVETDMERVEVLNALGRVALAQGREADALRYWEQLKPFSDVLDADGAHPLSLSVLRLVERLSFKRAFPVVQDWVAGVLEMRYPLYPGMSYAVRILEQWADRHASRYEQAREIRKQLNQISHWANLVDVWQRLHSAGMGDLGYAIRAGMNVQGESVLVCLKAQGDSLWIGAQVDMDALVDSLMQTSVGQEIRGNGFALSLFDVDAAQYFKVRHQDVMHLIAPASATLYRLNFGFYTRGDLQVFQVYRERNTWVLMGVLALAGLIGVGVFLMYRDITREVMVAKLRSDFVSNVSHELRTPLTSIRMYAETLFMKRYYNEEQVQTYLETIMQESQRLSRMVGNILDFSRMESGRKTYAFDGCDPKILVQTVVDEFDPILQEQGFALALDVASDVPVVQADREALEMALANLLSNAVKYSRDRKDICVRVWTQENQVVFEVADRGVGVPAFEKQAIFEKFHRASNAGEVATGTGLGLALVKGVMVAHKGSVSYLPREGGGSIFRLYLPVTN